MSRHFAFLRGINLGKRQIKMADLKTCLSGIGLRDIRTIVASGNVGFETDDDSNLQARMEAVIAKTFGFQVGVVLRSESEIATMLANAPFGQLDPQADLTRHVMLFDTPLPAGLALNDRPGHTEVVRIDVREIYLAGYRQPNGRYTEGMDDLGKQIEQQLGKDRLMTARNWNTIEKALK
ncbi:DUF1697 domain-containing protein [Devosia sp. BSSL-BM10]|uniref:DUF1697 domain-containing protein n=1 Tax=Devosia litorisediminis TaxID=2829817 RepID=A0A942EAC9_9HYPH|nr:DUF1697 domain-containing protein [Devosia litorisediminis]MBS3850526.1 DUF1697 domain-containing protein [Devosia litorisediminis]